jgi:hypothetical protein
VPPTNFSLTAAPAWRALAERHAQLRSLHLRELFANDPRRGDKINVTEQRVRNVVKDRHRRFRSRTSHGLRGAAPL